MDIVDSAQVLAAVAAIGTVAAATLEIHRYRSDARVARAMEIEGVSVVTNVVHRPNRPDAGGGFSRWVYKFTVHNPGRFPISGVDVRVTFETEIQREHYDGEKDPPATELEMGVPVVPAAGENSWTRTIIVDHEQRSRLRETRASVEFTTPDGGRVVTHWPSGLSARRIDKRLVMLLGSSD